MFFFSKKKTSPHKSPHHAQGGSGGDVAGLIVGLGNPGPKYAGTRHNMGFMVVEELLKELGKNGPEPEEMAQGKKFQSFLWRCRFPEVERPWLLAMPQTFMNLSGEAVQPLMSWYKLSPDKLLVVHDELDLAPGTMMLKTGGGLAGHNGLKSIAQRLGNNTFHRLRLGIGRPEDREQMISWVTTRFSPQDAELVAEILPKAARAVADFAALGPAKAANRNNSKKKRPPSLDSGE